MAGSNTLCKLMLAGRAGGGKLTGDVIFKLVTVVQEACVTDGACAVRERPGANNGGEVGA